MCVPWIDLFLGRKTRSGTAKVVFLACTAGTLLPPLVAAILFFPLTILLYMGIKLPFAMLWGAIGVAGRWPWDPITYSLPGIIWGIIAGLLRWRYFSLEKEVER